MNCLVLHGLHHPSGIYTETTYSVTHTTLVCRVTKPSVYSVAQVVSS